MKWKGLFLKQGEVSMYVNLLGYKIYVDSKKNLVYKIESHLVSKNNEKINIVSGNPEVLLNGIENLKLNKFFKRQDNLIIPDGIGVIILLKFFKKYVTEKIAGIEIMEEVLSILDKNNLGVYFLGASEENLQLAIKNITNKHPNINIKGFHNGYFDETQIIEIINSIKISKPEVLFVGMGSPKQDIIISEYMDELDCKIFMGVGGSLDLYSGKIKRAPKIMINLGLEWLYRVSNEPVRIKRLWSIPKFMCKSIKYHFKGRCK